jgi:hypothetical protein
MAQITVCDKCEKKITSSAQFVRSSNGHHTFLSSDTLGTWSLTVSVRHEANNGLSQPQPKDLCANCIKEMVVTATLPTSKPAAATASAAKAEMPESVATGRDNPPKRHVPTIEYMDEAKLPHELSLLKERSQKRESNYTGVGLGMRSTVAKDVQILAGYSDLLYNALFTLEHAIAVVEKDESFEPNRSQLVLQYGTGHFLALPKSVPKNYTHKVIVPHKGGLRASALDYLYQWGIENLDGIWQEYVRTRATPKSTTTNVIPISGGGTIDPCDSNALLRVFGSVIQGSGKAPSRPD